MRARSSRPALVSEGGAKSLPVFEEREKPAGARLDALNRRANAINYFPPSRIGQLVVIGGGERRSNAPTLSGAPPRKRLRASPKQCDAIIRPSLSYLLPLHLYQLHFNFSAEEGRIEQCGPR